MRGCWVETFILLQALLPESEHACCKHCWAGYAISQVWMWTYCLAPHAWPCNLQLFQFSVACFASLWHFVFNGAFVASYKLSLVAIIMSTQEHKMCCHCIPSICKPGLSETLTLQSTVWLEATVERCTTAFWQWPRKVIWSDWDSLPGNISTTFSSVQALFSYVEKGCDAGASINKCTQDWTAFESAIHQRLPVGQLSFDVLLRDYLHVRYQHQWCY